LLFILVLDIGYIAALAAHDDVSYAVPSHC
jgi:hypothetical protein